MIKSLENFQANVDKEIIRIAVSEDAQIIDWNIAQLELGKENTGNDITPQYAPLTIQIKREKGQPTSRVTLKDEGDFHDSFFVVINAKSFAIYARDDKTEKLERKYGKEIFGLDDQNLQDLIDLIKPDFISEFRKQVLNE